MLIEIKVVRCSSGSGQNKIFDTLVFRTFRFQDDVFKSTNNLKRCLCGEEKQYVATHMHELYKKMWQPNLPSVKQYSDLAPAGLNSSFKRWQAVFYTQRNSHNIHHCESLCTWQYGRSPWEGGFDISGGSVTSSYRKGVPFDTAKLLVNPVLWNIG